MPLLPWVYTVESKKANHTHHDQGQRNYTQDQLAE